MYNLFSCSGFGTEVMGGCSMGWLGFVFLFFVCALSRKWIGEAMGIGYSFMGALVGSMLTYFIILTIFGAFKWALLGGLAGYVIGGFLLGMFTGGEDYE